MGKRTVVDSKNDIVFAAPKLEAEVAKATWSLTRVEREAKEMFTKLEGLAGAVVKAKVRLAFHNVSVGDFLHRVERDWVEAGKPCKKPELWKACGVTSADASRFRKLATWWHDNEANFEDADDETKAEAIAAQLAELRSMNKASTSARNADPVEDGEGEGEAVEASLSKAEIKAHISDMVEETIDALIQKLGLDVEDEKIRRIMKTELTELATTARNIG